MKTLDQIAIECKTDRASVFTRTHGTPHNYAVHYDRLFGPMRNRAVKLLEIGVGGGEGVRMWLEYFERGNVYGVDIQHDTNEWDAPGVRGYYCFNQGDQGSEVFWQCFVADHGKDWDVIIDDGSHISKDIITTFHELWPVLKPGGFYAIEDLATSYGGAGSMFTPEDSITQVQFLHEWMDALNLGRTTDLDSIYLARELAVLKKK